MDSPDGRTGIAAEHIMFVRQPNAATKASRENGPPSRIPGCPSCGIPVRTLGPAPEIRGDVQAAAFRIEEMVRRRSVSSLMRQIDPAPYDGFAPPSTLHVQYLTHLRNPCVRT